MPGKQTETVYGIMLTKKGYTLDEVAERWGMTYRSLMRKCANPKQIDWDAAVGLPMKKLVRASDDG